LPALNLRGLALICEQALLRGDNIEISDQPAGITIKRDI